MPSADPVATSLELAAERGLDVTEQIYHCFAARRPQWAGLMSHMDAYMRGRMMQDVLVLLSTPPDHIDGPYLHFEVSAHRAYGVQPDMFPALFEAVVEVLRDQLGAAWTPSTESAWRARTDALATRIESAAAG